jgi:hypothetical protein
MERGRETGEWKMAERWGGSGEEWKTGARRVRRERGRR